MTGRAIILPELPARMPIVSAMTANVGAAASESQPTTPEWLADVFPPALRTVGHLCGR
jgi:hypothetical protein